MADEHDEADAPDEVWAEIDAALDKEASAFEETLVKEMQRRHPVAPGPAPTA